MARKFKLLAVLCLGLLWPQIATAETQRFNEPMFEGTRLDYCRAEERGCGRGAARAFCRRQGIERMESFQGPVSVRRTTQIRNRTTCQGRNCSGFAVIVCERDERRGAQQEAASEEEGNSRFPVISVPNQREPFPVITQLPQTSEPEAPEPKPSGTFTYRPPANPSGPNYGAFANLAGPAIAGCEAENPGPRDYECSSIAAYHNCQEHLRDGTVRDCVVELYDPNSRIQFQRPHPNTFDVTTTSNIQVSVQRSNRDGGEAQGNAHWDVEFTRPAEYRNPGCDPNSPIVSAGDCMRRCETKNKYTYDRDGRAGGVFAISGLDTCDSVIRSSRAPDEYDLLRSWDICQATNAWGGSAHGQIRFRIAGLYHMSDPHTSHNGNNWEYENEADVIAPYVNVSAPVTIFCADR